MPWKTLNYTFNYLALLIIPILLIAFSPQPAIADGTLVGHWKMDEGNGETLLDNSGFGNHASLQKTKDVTWIPGVDGLALFLPGNSNRYAVAPNHASLNITDAITIAAWIRPDDISTRTILSKSSPDGYELTINDDGLIEFRYNFDTNGNDYRITSNSSYAPDGTWMHIAATYDGTTSNIYVNGALDASITYSNPPSINTNNSGLYIGSLDGSRRWKGALDDVRLYQGALTESEINQVMNNVPPVDPPAAPVLTSPSNASTDIAVNPVLNWETVPGAATYSAVISGDPGFASPVFSQGGITTHSIQAPNLDEGTVYYWRVRATNNGGDGNWSEIWNFTTQTTPPPPPPTSLTLIHYWNFNNTADLLAPAQTINSGTITVDLAASSETEDGSGNDFTGENARNGDPIETHFRLNTPIGSTVTYHVSTEGFEDIIVKYETRRSGSGAGLQKISYSLDGNIFTDLPDVTVTDGIPTLETFDFTAISGANDNPDFTLRIQFEQGAGGIAGNNRFDNVTVEGNSTGSINLPPVVDQPVPFQQLIAGNTYSTIDLSAVFSDPDNDPLTYSATSSNTEAATATVSGNLLQINPLAAGGTNIELVANDGNSNSAPTSFRVLVYPEAIVLSTNHFNLSSWNQDEPEGSFPPNAIFLQTETDDPDLAQEPLYPYAIPADDYASADAGNVGFPYRNTSRTRLNGLGDQGISFINTGRGRDLGATLVAVDTRNIPNAKITFTSETLAPNFRVYDLAVLYRVGTTGTWSPVLTEEEVPLVYSSKELAENSEETLTGYLPSAANDQEYVQVLFQYHYTGTQRVGGGARTLVRLDDIIIEEDNRPDIFLPGQVQTTTPADNAQDVSLSPELTWESLPNAATFNVEVATDNGFSGIVVQKTVAGQTSYTLESPLDANTTYFWRVMAVNSAGDGPWSEVKSFTTGEAEVFTLAINEVMSSNSSVIADEDGSYEDWIEIHNYGSTAVNLLGMGLSDNYGEPFKWTFPDRILGPGEFLLVWASSKNRVDPSGPLHTNFAVGASGEEVILTAPNGLQLDEMPPEPIPSNTSRGHEPDGTGALKFFDPATPGATNTGGVGELITKASFSQAPGIYPSDFSLTLTHPDPQVTLRYTLDGSVPTATSPVYQQPLQIEDRSGEPNEHSMIPTNFISGSSRSWFEPEGLVRKGTVVRVKAFTSNGQESETLTGTFLVLPERQYTLPVVSVVSPLDSLFGDERGIYVPGDTWTGEEDSGNYNQLGDDWERPGSIELFAPELTFQQDIGLRINGDHTRRFPQKSLRILARGEYGKSTLDYPVFPNYPFDSYKRLVLRNSGNDYGHTMFIDATCHLLVNHFMPVQNYRPTVTFINGEYWGIHNIRERVDKHYIGRVYNVDPDNIDLMTYQYDIQQGEDVHYKEMLDYIENTDLSDDNNFEGLKTRMDVENFMDYYSAEIYYGNDDWPHSNIDYWRARVPYNPNAPLGHDGRWRWLMYDTDRAFRNASFNSVSWVTAPLSPDIDLEWPNLILRNLLDNQGFKYDFINRMADHLNTAFTSTRVVHVVDSIKAIVAPEMQEHSDRWGRPSSVENWEEDVDEMITFANARPANLRQFIKDEFNLGNELTITLDVSNVTHGSIGINSLVINSNMVGLNAQQPYPWQGIYFGNVPLKLKALANQGYVFDHWLVDGQVNNNVAIMVTPTSNMSIEAVFVSTNGVKPVLTSPADNATDVDISPVTFSWEAVPEATSYQLQVSRVPDFSTTIVDQSGINTTTTDVPGLSNNTLYYWRIMSTGADGTSDWSDVWNFTTVPSSGTLPGVVTLNTPANNATGVAVNPTLQWDPASDATNYTVQVSELINFSSFVVNQDNVSATSQQVNGLLNNKIYYWRVRANNASGNAAWSQVWNFTTAPASTSIDLVGHWKMDEGNGGNTFIDHSGYGNHAEIQKTSSGVDWVPGIQGLAVELSGGTNRIGIAPNHPSLNITDKITIAAWIRPVELNTRSILSKTGQDGYQFGLNNDGKVQLKINDDSMEDIYRVESNTSYVYDGSTWTHVAATFDGTTAKIYINGTLDVTVHFNTPTTINTNSSGLYIGSLLGSRRWKGALDDVRLYHGTLDASEIAQIATPPNTASPAYSITVAGEQPLKVKIYPNPFHDRINLEFNKALKGRVSIVLSDALGRTYIQSHQMVEGNRMVVNLPGKDFKPGMYLLTVKSSGLNQVLKIMKK